MSEPVETPTVVDQTTEKEITTFANEETASNKRPVDDSEETDNREAKTMKLDTEQTDKETADNESSKTDEATNIQENSDESTESKPETVETEKPATSNPPLINLAQGAHPPPPGLHLLTDPQQQQLLQSYVQAQGHDLANLTASSLAQAMVSPITVPTLASNLIHQLQQGGNIITALPGPPPQLPHQPPALNQHNPAPLGEEAQGANKRTNARSLTNDERRQRRLLRNRVAAKECRKKKKKHIQDMEEKIVQLEEENAKLAKEVDDLKTKLSLGASTGGEYLLKELDQENKNLKKEVEELQAKVSLGSLESSEQYRLMKEVEELNAKLSIGGALPTGGAFTAAVMAVQQKQQERSSISDTTTTSTTTAAIQPATARMPVVVPAPSSASDIESEAINTSS